MTQFDIESVKPTEQNTLVAAMYSIQDLPQNMHDKAYKVLAKVQRIAHTCVLKSNGAKEQLMHYSDYIHLYDMLSKNMLVSSIVATFTMHDSHYVKAEDCLACRTGTCAIRKHIRIKRMIESWQQENTHSIHTT